MTGLQRPDLRPRLRHSVLWGTGIITFGVLSALAGHHLQSDDPVVVPIVTPVITPMQVASPEVTVTMPAPPDPVIPPAPAPPKPRALVPTLDPACVLAPEIDPTSLDDGYPVSPACEWDDGFPAISADGSTIVTKFVPDDGGRGNPGLTIRFIDTRTSKLVRDALVLAPDEFDNADRAKLQTKITQRAAAIQRSLDAAQYRTLAPLGTSHLGDSTSDVDTTKLHAEFAGEVVRVVDPTTATAVWRHDFTRPAPKRAKPAEEDMCGAWFARTITLHHDSATGYVLATQTYDTGGCLCTSETITTVAHIPR